MLGGSVAVQHIDHEPGRTGQLEDAVSVRCRRAEHVGHVALEVARALDLTNHLKLWRKLLLRDAGVTLVVVGPCHVQADFQPTIPHDRKNLARATLADGVIDIFEAVPGKALGKLEHGAVESDVLSPADADQKPWRCIAPCLRHTRCAPKRCI